MWTSSYVLVAGGCSLAVLALAYWAVEVTGLAQGLDLAVAGVRLECDCGLHDQRTAGEWIMGTFRQAR